jgi:hypothetical protein
MHVKVVREVGINEFRLPTLVYNASKCCNQIHLFLWLSVLNYVRQGQLIEPCVTTSLDHLQMAAKEIIASLEGNLFSTTDLRKKHRVFGRGIKTIQPPFVQ